MGNFAFDRWDFPPEVFWGIDIYLKAHGMKREEYFARSNKTVMLKGKATKDGIKEIVFLPVEPNKKYQPEVKKFRDPKAKAIVNLLQELSAGFGTKFSYRRSGLNL